MPFLAPSAARLPPLAYLLADQLAPRKKIARHLGLSLRTLQRYIAAGHAPRAVCHLPAHKSRRVFGAMKPVDFRRKGATAFSAYWSHLS
ncbi:MAG: helix-turn-helix domain-containing protein [Proteobacteria bacterium]|nr:helix-turn-helix domain-containing protein [Pseudomonadota bacterium]